MKGNWSPNFQFTLKNSLKLPRTKKVIFRSLQTILLCIVGEVSGGVSVAVAVGFSDVGQMTL